MSAILRMSFRAQSNFLQNSAKLCGKTSVVNLSKAHVSSQETRVNPFTIKGLFKHYELLPLVIIVGAGTIGLGIYGIYFCNTRNDVQFRKQATYDPMNLQKPPVLKMVNTIDYKEFKPLTELEGLYKEMAEAEEQSKTK